MIKSHHEQTKLSRPRIMKMAPTVAEEGEYSSRLRRGLHVAVSFKRVYTRTAPRIFTVKWIPLLFLFGNAFAQAENQSVALNTPDHPIVVTANNPSFTLHLKSNPTTGFFWYLRKYNHYQLVPIDHQFKAPNHKNLVGAPGEEIWTFGVQRSAFVVPKVFRLHFTYMRPWTTENKTEATFTVVTRK